MRTLVNKLKLKTKFITTGLGRTKRLIFQKFSQVHNKEMMRSVFLLALFVVLSVTFQLVLRKSFLQGGIFAATKSGENSLASEISIEKTLKDSLNSNVEGISKRRFIDKIRSDVGFGDKRVLTLEDFFTYYNSPLAEEADEFIKAAERYGMENWQLLPAIAMAETSGCKTGFSDAQKNCWGWGGSGENRWEFDTYAEAIDLITYRLVKGYSNEHLNPKYIQATYCGPTCDQWGYRWAEGVHYYIVMVNDFGLKYGITRTHEEF